MRRPPLKLAAQERGAARRRRVRRSRAAQARGAVLLARRHRPLHRAAEDLRALRGLVPLRRGRPRVSRPADVVLGGQFRLRQPPAQRRAQAPDRPPAAGREPVPAPREDRARRADRARRRGEVRAQGPRAFQRRRRAGGRGFAQARAQRLERQEPDVRLRGRLSRPHARRLRHHLVLPLSAALRPFRRARAVRAVPVSLPRAEGHEQGGVRPPLRAAVRAPVRERVQRRVGPEGGPGRVRRVLRRADPGHRRLRDPAEELLRRIEEGARPLRHPAWWWTRSRWASSAPASCGRSSISA